MYVQKRLLHTSFFFYFCFLVFKISGLQKKLMSTRVAPQWDPFFGPPVRLGEGGQKWKTDKDPRSGIGRQSQPVVNTSTLQQPLVAGDYGVQPMYSPADAPHFQHHSQPSAAPHPLLFSAVSPATHDSQSATHIVAVNSEKMPKPPLEAWMSPQPFARPISPQTSNALLTPIAADREEIAEEMEALL